VQRDLVTLNISKNRLRVIENLSGLKALSTLTISHNELSTVADIAHLRECPSITCLDIQENKLDDPGVLDVFMDMPGLAVLYLQGNPCVKRIRHYRKMVVGRLPGLKYLDDRPVFPEERSRCNVWYSVYLKEGEAAATAAERVEMTRLAEEKKAEEDRNFHAFAEFTRRAAARDPHAFQSLLPSGGGVEDNRADSSPALAPDAMGEEKLDEEEKVDEELERYKRLCEEDKEEEEEDWGHETNNQLCERKEGDLDDGVGRYSVSVGGGVIVVNNAVSDAMSRETPTGQSAREELWERVVSVATTKLPPLTDVESLE